MPPSPTATLVLRRSKGITEQQTWKHSCSAMRIGFSTREKTWVSTREQVDLLCPALVLQGLQQRWREAQVPLLTPQNPNFKKGERGLSREPSTLKIETVGRKNVLRRNAWEGGK